MTWFRVYLGNRHISSYKTREDAERVIAGWLRDWNGEFTIREVKQK